MNVDVIVESFDIRTVCATEAIPEFGSKTPLKRAGQPVEMAPAYVLLATQESSYITGEVIGATGGIASCLLGRRLRAVQHLGKKQIPTQPAP